MSGRSDIAQLIETVLLLPNSQEVLREDLAFLPQHQYSLVEGTKGKLKSYQPGINVRLNTWNIATWPWAEG